MTRQQLTTKHDYYLLLGIQPTATAKDIKRAYRKMALALHPDVNRSADAAAKFKELSQAYQTLINPMRRAAYDQMREAAKQGRIPVNYNPSSGPIPGATGEFFSWNAAYYAAWTGQETGQRGDHIPQPPPVTSLVDVLFRFGHKPVPWILILTLGMGVGVVVWWEGSPAGRSAVLVGMILCAAFLLFQFAQEISRHRATLRTPLTRFFERSAFYLGLTAVLAALVLGGMTLVTLIEPLEYWIQSAAAALIGFLSMRWFVLNGRRYRERHQSQES